MKKIGIAVIGSGNISQNYHLPILKDMPQYKIVAICDKRKSNANYLAGKYNIPYVCSNIHEALTIDEVEAVDICASTDAHAELAIAAMENGKAVFIEKPVARSLKEAELIHETQKRTGAKAMVGMNQRFRYDAKMMKSYILQKEIGEVFYAKAGWQQRKHGRQWRQEIDKSGGGVLIDLGISVIDSLMWFFDFAKVRAVNAAVFHHLTNTVEDVCAGSIFFENGSLATFDVSWTLFSAVNNFYFDIHGSAGSIKINPLQLFKSSGDKFQPVYSEVQKTNLGIYRRSYESELKQFAFMLRDVSPAISTVEESVMIMRIVDALYLSAKERVEIYL